MIDLIPPEYIRFNGWSGSVRIEVTDSNPVTSLVRTPLRIDNSKLASRHATMLKEEASQMGLGEQVSLWPPIPVRLGKTRKNRRAGCIYICVALRMNGSNSQIANIVSLKCKLLKSFSYSIVRYASWVLVDVGTSAHEGLSSIAKGDRDLAK